MTDPHRSATRIVSTRPAEKWEDAMISGNGATGVMVLGQPVEETIVVNHEKLWVPMVDVKRDVTDMRAAMAAARELARQDRFVEASDLIMARFTEANRKTYDLKHLVRGRRLPPERRERAGYRAPAA